VTALRKPVVTDMLHGQRYLRDHPTSIKLGEFIVDELPYLDYKEACRWYRYHVPSMVQADQALLGCNDRFFLLTTLLGREDAMHPWLFARAREVEADPDDHLDLWAREHFKSSLITCTGSIQEIMRDPDITIGLFSHTKPIASAFLAQIQREFETNEQLKATYPDVCWDEPRKEAPLWSRDRGIIVKRRSNPKEATVEAHGLVDGQPTSRHFKLRIYDDVVTRESVTTPEMIRKTTEAWELSDNLSSGARARKQMAGTRYHFGDTYGVILEEGRGLKPRVYTATDDGTLSGNPVLYSKEWWAKKKQAQRSTISAQMLLNPVAGNEAMFRAEWLKPYEVRPTILNVYIMVDPSKGRTKNSDRTAIAVVGVDVGGNRYLLDGVRHRMPLSERWGHLKRLYEKWQKAIGVQIVTVGYERYGAQTEDEVIRQWQERDKVSFELHELAWPREGGHSKPDRVERLEPDFRSGRFYLPGVVYYPNMSGQDGLATWSIKPPAKDEKGRVIEGTAKVTYQPYRGQTRAQMACERSGQGYRVMGAIRAIDEDRNVYDVTRALIEEMMLFPFSPKDDLVDAVSRLYDLEPRPAVAFETELAEIPVFEDT
jgi:phage terminase large subunit-like protein